jgi:hypothetical protein
MQISHKFSTYKHLIFRFSHSILYSNIIHSRSEMKLGLGLEYKTPLFPRSFPAHNPLITDPDAWKQYAYVMSGEIVGCTLLKAEEKD